MLSHQTDLEPISMKLDSAYYCPYHLDTSLFRTIFCTYLLQ